MKKYDICALGELLIDFTENGISEDGNPIMQANPGGAPCNVLAMMAKLNRKTAFIGKVGDDIFGRQLRTAICEAGINADGLCTDKAVNTTLAFVHTLPDGDREFSFYRNPGADAELASEEVAYDIIGDSRIFHFGTLSMTHEKCENATVKAVEYAEKSGCIISFDPNLRENLWDNLDKAREKTDFGLRHCDILKISDNEIEWFTGEKNHKKAVGIIREKYKNIELILLTLGKNGSMAFSGQESAFVPAYTVKTVDTTGAGDTFFGAVLSKVIEYGKVCFNDSELKEILLFANTAAAIVTTRKGALKVMPSAEEIDLIINTK